MNDVLPWSLVLLSGVGVITLVTLVLHLFFALGRRPQRLFAEHVPAVDDEDQFLLALAGAVNAPTRAGGGIEILDNGDEFFPAILEALDEARLTINFFTYIFERGTIGDRVLDLLSAKAQGGVQVRLLLDRFGALTINRTKLEALQRAGGRTAWHRPFGYGRLTRLHRRNHRRAIVVDGRIGFTGGASMSDKWLGTAQSPDQWRDCMFRVTGSLARSLQATFSAAWSNTTGEVLTGREFYPFGLEDDGEGVPVSRHVNLISSPSDVAHPLRLMVWLSFMAARETLYLTSSYFVPDVHLRRALRDRARAGVDVRILLPGRYTDVKPVRWAGQSYYDQLLRAGVRIYEYQPTFIHTKALVVDGKWSVIGSANTDIRSKELNEENVLGILDAGFACALEQTFFGDLEHAREIRLDEWRRRGLAARLRERFFVLFAEQY